MELPVVRQQNSSHPIPVVPRRDVTLNGLNLLRGWLSTQGWRPFAFQESAWAAYAKGESGLIQVPTGAGKTYAAYFGPLASLHDEPQAALTVVVITPLRALARDLTAALQRPVTDLKWPIRVELRSGDTPSTIRQRQRKQWPHVLVITPESLALLLTYSDAPTFFAKLRGVIVDEWHELFGTKRGALLELCLARLRAFAPRHRTWALSATLANVHLAAQAAVGMSQTPVILHDPLERPIQIDPVLPPIAEAFPWAGLMGLRMLKPVLAALDFSRGTLLFTHTRSQAERWYQALIAAVPHHAHQIALHHGSLDRSTREQVEAGLKSGAIRVAVCTAALDLGVDFPAVDVVIQLGAIKHVARLMQRAGRSGHRPGGTCRVLCVPTHALELVEIAAARMAVARHTLESRVPHCEPFDVLVQHLVTCALGGGFTADALFDEVRSTLTYAQLSRSRFDQALRQVTHGGDTLAAYPEFCGVTLRDSRHTVSNVRLARLHRMNIGTIVSDSAIAIKLGRVTLGHVEEHFIATLEPGDAFYFSGRALEFVGLENLVAHVRPAKRPPTRTPAWHGGRLPLSEVMAAAVQEVLAAAGHNEFATPELLAARPALDLQRRMSRLPQLGEFLVEWCVTADGHHAFFYPFAGRLVHEGLAALVALRLSRRQRATFEMAANDYGFELLSATAFPFAQHLTPDIFDCTAAALDADIQACVNLTELARRQFREVARIAGLVRQTFPGAPKSVKHIQASAELIYSVFQQYDPAHPLLQQARDEVLAHHFERDRLVKTLRRIQTATWHVVRVERPTPLAWPLLTQRWGMQLGAESLLERIVAMRRASTILEPMEPMWREQSKHAASDRVH